MEPRRVFEAGMNFLWRWLTDGRGWLFGPPLKASLTIHIDHKGDAHLYGPKPEELTPMLEMQIAEALTSLGGAWAAAHGLTGSLPEHE